MTSPEIGSRANRPCSEITGPTPCARAARTACLDPRLGQIDVGRHATEPHPSEPFCTILSLP